MFDTKRQPARFFFCTFSLTLPIILLLGSIAEAQKYQQRIIQSVAVPADRLKAIQDWQAYMEEISRMPAKDRPNETDLHEQFFTDVFVKVLGYQKRTASQTEWTLRSEYTTDVDKTRPDGVLGFFNGNREEKQIRAVIELKGPNADLDRRPFIAWSQNLHQLAAERLKRFRLFTDLLKAEFKLEQLSPALMQWHKHSFARFLDELKDARGARLAGKQKEDWQECFKRLQQEIQGLNVEIQKGEQQLNGLVNELYGLTKEEVRYLKN